jgi:hypothetical protein
LLKETGAMTRTSITLPVDTPRDRWEALVVFASRTREATQWWLGDLLNFGEEVYGESGAQVAEITVFKPATLETYQSLAKAIPKERRIEGLSAYTHRAVMRLDPEQQTFWLEQAFANGWDYYMLDAEIQKALPAPKDAPRGRGRPRRTDKASATDVMAIINGLPEPEEVEDTEVADFASVKSATSIKLYWVKMGPFEDEATAQRVAAEMTRVHGDTFGISVAVD